MRKRYRQRHKLRRIVARITEHHTLIARAVKVIYILLALFIFKRAVNAHGNIGRLLINCRHNRAGVSVKSGRGTVIAYLAHNVARYLRDINVTFGRYFAHYRNTACCAECFAGNAGFRVVF